MDGVAFWSFETDTQKKVGRIEASSKFHLLPMNLEALGDLLVAKKLPQDISLLSKDSDHETKRTTIEFRAKIHHL